MSFLKTIGKITWGILGVLFLITIISWGSYVIARDSISSVIVLIPLIGVIILFIVYLAITFSFKIFGKVK